MCSINFLITLLCDQYLLSILVPASKNTALFFPISENPFPSFYLLILPGKTSIRAVGMYPALGGDIRVETKKTERV